MSEDSGGNVNIKELKELLEAYNKYMEQVNEFYYFTSRYVFLVSSTTSVPPSLLGEEEKEREGAQK
jgi:hypothetical protein